MRPNRLLATPEATSRDLRPFLNTARMYPASKLLLDQIHPHIHKNAHTLPTGMGWKDAESGLGPLFPAWQSNQGNRDRMI